MSARFLWRVCWPCALLLAGCASTEVQRARARSALDSAAATLAAQPLSAGFDDPRAASGALQEGLHTQALDASRPVFQFDDGRAYFVVLELPQFTAPYQIEVFPRMSLVAMHGLAQTATFATLWPALTLLDANYQVLSSLMPRYRDEPDRYLSAGGMFGYISVCDAQPRYVAMHGVPSNYRRLNNRIVTTYSQYGSSSSSFDMVQMPQGEVDIGLPTKAVGKSIFGGKPELPCTLPDRSVEEFRGELGE